MTSPAGRKLFGKTSFTGRLHVSSFNPLFGMNRPGKMVPPESNRPAFTPQVLAREWDDVGGRCVGRQQPQRRSRSPCVWQRYDQDWTDWLWKPWDGCRDSSTCHFEIRTFRFGGDVQLVAMADVFESNLHAAFRSIKGQVLEQVDTGTAVSSDWTLTSKCCNATSIW